MGRYHDNNQSRFHDHDSAVSSSAKAGGYQSAGGKSKGRGNASPNATLAPVSSAAEDRFAALKPTEDSGSSRGGRGRQLEPWYQPKTVDRRDSELSNMSGFSNMSEDGEADESSARAKDVIFAEIKALVESNHTLVIGDFDFRVRQHLHAFYGSGGRERVRECLAQLSQLTQSKSRQSVKNWPAYLGALMKKFDADSATGDREARARARVAAARAASSAATSNSPPKDAEASGSAEASNEVAAKPAAEALHGADEMGLLLHAAPQFEEQPRVVHLGAVAEASAAHLQKLPEEQLHPLGISAQVPAPDPRPHTQPPSQPPLQPPTRPPAAPPSLPPMEPPHLPPHYSSPHAEHQVAPTQKAPIIAPTPVPEWLQGPIKRPLVLDFPLEAWAAWLRSPPSQPLEAR